MRSNSSHGSINRVDSNAVFHQVARLIVTHRVTMDERMCVPIVCGRDEGSQLSLELQRGMSPHLELPVSPVLCIGYGNSITGVSSGE